MDIMSAMQQRRSARAYLAKEVSRRTNEEILSCAALAPSAINLQPWEFIVTYGDEKDRLVRRLLRARLERQVKCGPGTDRPLPERVNRRAKEAMADMEPHISASGMTFNRFIEEGSCSFYGAPVAIIVVIDKRFPAIRAIPDAIKSRLMGENPPAAGDYPLWGTEFVRAPLDKVRLIVSSKDDPRYAIPQEIGVVSNPDTAFMYRTNELQTCKTYTGYLEATVLSHDPATGAVVTRTLVTGPRDIRMPCLDLRVKSEVVPAATCGDAPRNEVKIKFAPAAMDGKALKLLTLSQPLPNNAGDDVLYNVNYPNSVTLPQPPAEPNYIYTYTLNTSQYPEGVMNLTIYWVLEYTAPSELNQKLKIQMLRYEQIMRHMVTRLDKYAVEYNDKKRNGGFAVTEKPEA